MAVDFPTGVPNIPSANGANPLSTTHGAGVSQAAGTNRILTNLVALATKLGIGSGSPTARKLLTGSTTAGTTGWADFAGTTLLVAANNAHAATKALANYVCDGANDEVEIQAALAALPATVRGRVLLSEGTFFIHNQIGIGAGSDNTTLEGMGIGATELRCVAGTGTNGGILVVNAVRVRVASLYITGNAGQTSQTLLYCSNAWGVVENVRVNGSGAIGIYLDGNSNGWVVDRCVAAGSAQDGIRVSNNSQYGHRITNCHAYGNGYSGIEVQGGTRTLLAHNSCISNGNAGISTGSATYTQIFDNVCRANTNNGIYVGGGTYASVQGNLVQSNAQHGIQINTAHATLVVNNWVDSNSTASSASYQGIWINASDYCFVDGNTVRRGGGAQHQWAILVGGTGNKIGTNDVFDGASQAGLIFDGGTTTRRTIKTQLDWTSTTDWPSLNPTGNVWVALHSDGSANTFRVNSPTSVIIILVTGQVSIMGPAVGTNYGTRLVVDGGNPNMIGGGSLMVASNYTVASLSGAMVIAGVTLGVGNHTVTPQIWISASGTTTYFRTGSQGGYEHYRVRVLEIEA